MRLNFQRLQALVRKETIQILRDRRFIALILSMTLIQMFVYSYAASQTVYHLPLAVVDQSQDANSRGLIQALINSQYFDWTLQLPSQAEALQAVDRGEVKAAVIIPPNFASDLSRGTANLQFLLDGSDNFAVRSGYNAAVLVAQNYGLQLTAEKVARASGGALPVTASTHILYNPDLTSAWFVLPGIIGMILQTLAVEQAALFVVRDRELGMVEQILATPVRQLELILSKLIPLSVLCLLVFGISIAISIFWFGVPFQGDLLLYVWLALLFIASCLGLGLFISTRARTQLEAEATALIFMLLGMVLSGLFYPRTGMPLVPQLIGDLAPLTYFIRISRGIYTKGVGLNFVGGDAVALVVYVLIIVLITARRFKMRLD